jgi:hypothetical protein
LLRARTAIIWKRWSIPAKRFTLRKLWVVIVLLIAKGYY